MSEGPITAYERYLTGDYEHGKLMFIENDDPFVGPELTMFLMDAEYDPVRITFDPDSTVSVHSDGLEWHSFTSLQLRRIANACRQADAMWAEWSSKHESDDDAF